MGRGLPSGLPSSLNGDYLSPWLRGLSLLLSNEIDWVRRDRALLERVASRQGRIRADHLERSLRGPPY